MIEAQSPPRLITPGRPLKILLWAAYGAGTHYWGPGRSAYNMYSLLSQDSGIEIHLAHGFAHQETEGPFTTSTLIRPLDKGRVSQLLFIATATRWIRRNAHKFDLMHALSAFEYSLSPLRAFQRQGKPTFVKITGEFGGISARSHLSNAADVILRRKQTLNRATGIISISSAIRSNLESNGIDSQKIIDIPNGVDTAYYTPAEAGRVAEIRKSLGLDPQAITLLFLGGLSPRKRIMECVLATCALLDARKRLQLLIVGPDRSGADLHSKIEHLARGRNHTECIRLFGNVADPRPYLQASDIFLLPSVTEGLSNALLEAMSSGVAPIVTPISGSADLVKNDVDGIYCEGSVESIADAIFRYISSPDLLSRHRRAARQRIELSYSSKSVLEQHLSLFRNHAGRG